MWSWASGSNRRLIEVTLLWLVLFGLSWALPESEIALQTIEYLRQRFFIFVKEPLLSLHLYIAIDTFVLKLGAMLAVAVVFWCRGEKLLNALALDKRAHGTRTATLLFSCFALLVGVLNGFDVLSPNLPVSLFFRESAYIGNGLALVSMLLIAPVTEEIFFRGFMQPALVTAFGAFLGVGLTAAAFTAVHWPNIQANPSSIWIFLIGGIWLSAARQWTGSTRYSIFLHLIYNLILTGAGFFRYGLYGF